MHARTHSIQQSQYQILDTLLFGPRVCLFLLVSWALRAVFLVLSFLSPSLMCKGGQVLEAKCLAPLSVPSFPPIIGSNSSLLGPPS